jgi:hypothetical protein
LTWGRGTATVVQSFCPLGAVMRVFVTSLAIGLLAFGTALQAGPLEDAFPTITSCYLRDYSDSHLAKHPEQRVTRIAVGPDLNAYAEGQVGAIRLSVVLRDGVALSEVADCRSKGASTFCVMDAELGIYTINATPEGIRLQVGEEGISFETFNPDEPDAVDRVMISGISGDDRVFDIPATRSSGCPVDPNG